VNGSPKPVDDVVLDEARERAERLEAQELAAWNKVKTVQANAVRVSQLMQRKVREAQSHVDASEACENDRSLQDLKAAERIAEGELQAAVEAHGRAWETSLTLIIALTLI